MVVKKILPLAITALVAAITVTGCMETMTQPMSSSDNLLISSASVAAITAINNELSLVSAEGVNVDSTTAVFTINWREFFNASNATATLVGRAFAVGPTSGRMHGGADMGSVYLNYSGNHVELQKRTDRQGGVAYSTFEGRCDSAAYTNVGFNPGAAYQFEATGATGFSAVKVSMTAPGALLTFKGPVNGDTVSSSANLTFSWSGGNAQGSILLTIMAGHVQPGVQAGPHPDSLRRPGGSGGPGQGGGRREMGPRGAEGADSWDVTDGFRFGDGPDVGDPNLPIDSSRAIIISLTNNPGSYTVTAAQLQALISKTGAKELDCMVSLLTSATTPHDAGSIKVMIGNDDQLHLFVK